MDFSASKGVRTVAWSAADRAVLLIDQRLLPNEFKVESFGTVASLAQAIRDMVVRGAPAIGAAGAYGMVIAAKSAAPGEDLVAVLRRSKRILDDARPTAVNLMWATARMVEFLQELHQAGFDRVACVSLLEEEAQFLADQDIEVNRAMGRHGAELIPQDSNVLHHCNTGSLATVDRGTALGVIYECHDQGKNVHVWVDETRPRLQGARLSAWELMRYEVPMHLIADNVSGLLMQQGKVDVVLYGADRVARNGDVANKIGTYKLSVVARENGIPVYPVVPTSTIDLNCLTGEDIPIEERGRDEVVSFGGMQNIAPLGCPVYNPAFDVTPYRYVTGIITEEGVCYPPFHVSLRKAKEAAERRIKSVQKKRLAEILKRSRL
jgi:methylthioribose-1-phosphate isomerase